MPPLPFALPAWDGATLALLGTLTLLELALSFENLLVLLLMTRRLDRAQARAALLLSLLGMLALRAGVLWLAAGFLGSPWLTAAGAAYLGFLGVREWRGDEGGEDDKPRASRSLPAAVLTLTVTDFALSADSLLAGMATLPGDLDRAQGLGLLLLAGALGTALLRGAAVFSLGAVRRALTRYPRLSRVPALVLLWVAVNLTYETALALGAGLPDPPAWVLPLGVLALLLGGWLWARRAPKSGGASKSGGPGPR